MNEKINPETLNVLMVFGIGTGLQLTNILSKKEIKHLILVDVNYKFLKASMYFIDWTSIIQEFSKNNKSITFIPVTKISVSVD